MPEKLIDVIEVVLTIVTLGSTGSLPLRWGNVIEWYREYPHINERSKKYDRSIGAWTILGSLAVLAAAILAAHYNHPIITTRVIMWIVAMIVCALCVNIAYLGYKRQFIDELDELFKAREVAQKGKEIVGIWIGKKTHWPFCGSWIWRLKGHIFYSTARTISGIEAKDSMDRRAEASFFIKATDYDFSPTGFDSMCEDLERAIRKILIENLTENVEVIDQAIKALLAEQKRVFVSVSYSPPFVPPMRRHFRSDTLQGPER
ncbi:MAG: hypothetical protein ABSE91_01365 [Patescibacteria group bacterium]|jgi:hypothetical protein